MSDAVKKNNKFRAQTKDLILKTVHVWCCISLISNSNILNLEVRISFTYIPFPHLHMQQLNCSSSGVWIIIQKIIKKKLRAKLPLHSHLCLRNELFLYNSYCPQSSRYKWIKSLDHTKDLIIILDKSSIKFTICSCIVLQVLCKSTPKWQHCYFHSWPLNWFTTLFFLSATDGTSN